MTQQTILSFIFSHTKVHNIFCFLGNVRPNIAFGSNFKATTPVYPLSVDPTSDEPGVVGVQPPDAHKPIPALVNFESNFKATTPVYPEFVEPSSPNPNSIGLLPPRNTDSASNVHVNFESNFKATTPVYPLSVDSTSANPDSLGFLPPKGSNRDDLEKNRVNFESNFKATTPVYPKSVESTSPNPDTVGLLPPKSNRDDNQDVQIDFESNFKATTPVYPQTVEPTSPDPNEAGLLAPLVNSAYNKIIESNFKATTPVYPKSVESTSVDPSLAGLLAPHRSDDNIGESNIVFDSNFKATTPVFPLTVEENNDKSKVSLNESEINSNISSLLQILPPKFDQSYKTNRDSNIETTVSPPSKFYQVPKLEPDFTIAEVETNDQLGIRINNFMKSLSGSQWHSLREQFKIPEYEFPLEENGRPSYEGTLNSFDAKPVKKKK